jgi:hypothetical protein
MQGRCQRGRQEQGWGVFSRQDGSPSSRKRAGAPRRTLHGSTQINICGVSGCTWTCARVLQKHEWQPLRLGLACAGHCQLQTQGCFGVLACTAFMPKQLVL